MTKPRPLFDGISPEMIEKEKIRKLRTGIRRLNTRKKNDDGYTSSAEDEAIVRSCLADQSPKVREAVIDALVDLNAVTWEDLEVWLFDADEDVRGSARQAIRGPSREEADDERIVTLLERSFKAFPDDWGPDVAMTMMACMSPGAFLELTWQAAERLLDYGNGKIALSLQCGYFESVIQQFNMGPDDRHIRPWVQGSDSKRKNLLLAVAGWLRLREENLVAIASALAGDADAEISDLARRMLAWRAKQA